MPADRRRWLARALAITPLLVSAALSAEPLRERTEAVAAKVERNAERGEAVEGAADLVEDRVAVKSDAEGDPVIEQKGEASFYGRDFDGKATASGEPFDRNQRTAAHPSLPLGSEATVTNLETGKSVEVEINDRGPYAKGRDIDLSERAARDIGLDHEGAAPVEIEAKIPPAPAQQTAPTADE